MTFHSLLSTFQRLKGKVAVVTGCYRKHKLQRIRRYNAVNRKYGMTEPEDEQTKEKICGIVNEFFDIFKSRNGSITGKELLGCDISTP